MAGYCKGPRAGGETPLLRLKRRRIDICRPRETAPARRSGKSRPWQHRRRSILKWGETGWNERKFAMIEMHTWSRAQRAQARVTCRRRRTPSGRGIATLKHKPSRVILWCSRFRATAFGICPSALRTVRSDQYVRHSRNNAWAGMPQIDDDYIVFKPAAPLTAVNVSNAGWTGKDRCPATGGLLVQVPMPTTFVVPNVLNTTGRYFSCPTTGPSSRPAFHPLCRGGPATSIIKFGGVDIYGDGRLGGHGGSSLSAVGGSIRLGELRPGKPIRHAIKIDVDSPVILAKCSTASECFRWPAFTADAGAPDRMGPKPESGSWHEDGALLAIPSSTNIDALGLESAPGQMLPGPCRIRGLYRRQHGRPSFVISAENGPTDRCEISSRRTLA